MSESKPTVFTEAQNIRAIQTSQQFDKDACLVDCQTYLELGEEAPRQTRAMGIPYPYEVFMPLSWDLQMERTKRITPEAYLGIDKEPLADTSAWDVMAAAGPDSAKSTYAPIADLISRGRVNIAIDTSAELLPVPGRSLPASRLKLFLATHFYRCNAVIDPDAGDRVDLLVDKLALLVMLEWLVAKAAESGIDKEADSLATIDGKIWLKFSEKYKNSLCSIESFIHQDLILPDPFTIPTAEWEPCFKALRSWPDAKARQVLLPLTVLDDWATRGIQEVWGRMEKTYADTLQKLARINERFPQRRKDHGFFYPLLDSQWRSVAICGDTTTKDGSLDPNSLLGVSYSLNPFKLQYRMGYAAPSLPYVQEIDMRPAFWNREASALSLELGIAAKKRRVAIDRINTAGNSVAQLESAIADAREANRQLSEVRRNVDELRSEVIAVGLKLEKKNETLIDPGAGGDVADVGVLWVLREYIENRIVQVPRTGTRSYTEQYLDVGPVKICGLTLFVPILRDRTVTETYTYLETVTERVTVQESVPAVNPLKDYLAQDIPDGAFVIRGAGGAKDDGRTGYFKGFVQRILPSGSLKNGSKDVRIFTLYDNGYRDQNGMSLPRVLADAENPVVRARLLLLLPVHERRLDGEMEVVRYLAVHNPVAPRRSYLRPRVFLVETYRHELMQEPGHWLGPLSYSVTLFPGENRRLKLVTETKLVTQQRQERRSTQRSAVEQRSSAREQVRQDFSDLKRNAKQTNWSANASGGVNLGFASFGGGASGGQHFESSNESTAKQLQDRVAESLQTVSMNNEVQVAASSESSSSESSASEQIVTFSNINQGRAVTHKFFQILHSYRSKVSLHDVRIVVERGEPLIPGLRVFQTDVVKLDQIQTLFPELTREDRERVLKKITGIVVDRMTTLGIKLQELSPGRLLFQPRDLAEKQWYVNSGSCFIDSEVAGMPATEPYVEAARDAEIAGQQARAQRLLKEAEALARGTLVLPAMAERVEINIDRKAAALTTEPGKNKDAGPQP